MYDFSVKKKLAKYINNLDRYRFQEARRTKGGGYYPAVSQFLECALLLPGARHHQLFQGDIFRPKEFVGYSLLGYHSQLPFVYIVF
jgi:hypothetical protein